VTRALSVITSKDRLVVYFEGLCSDPVKRAEFKEALVKIDQHDAEDMLAIVPARSVD